MTEQTKVEHLFNSTINEGSLYASRVAKAKTQAAGDYIAEQSIALQWLNEVNMAVCKFQVQFDRSFDLNGRERLELAIMLHDYYIEHIKEG